VVPRLAAFPTPQSPLEDPRVLIPPENSQRTRVSGWIIVMALRIDRNQRYSWMKNRQFGERPAGRLLVDVVAYAVVGGLHRYARI